MAQSELLTHGEVRPLSILGAAVLSMMIISGCSSPDTKSRSSADVVQQKSQAVSQGIVISVRAIDLSEDRAPLTIRAETQGRALAQVGGAILGALTNESTDDHAVRVNGQEITVQLARGETRVITQPGADLIALNQRVKIINGQPGTRVEPF